MKPTDVNETACPITMNFTPARRPEEGFGLPLPAMASFSVGKISALDDEFSTEAPTSMTSMSSLEDRPEFDDTEVQFLAPGEFGTLYTEQSVLHDDGCFARVLVAEEAGTGHTFAVKVLSKAKYRCGNADTVRHIAQRMQSLPDSKHVVRLRHVYEDAENFYMVQDLCMRGDLFAFVEQMDRDDLQMFERQLMCVMTEVLLALDHLHKHGLVHNDVKLENFVLASSKLRRLSQARAKLQQTVDRRRALAGAHVTLIDFDFVRECGAKQEQVLGTDGYIAPEAYDFKACPKSDVFSAGVLMYVIVTNMFPFPNGIFVDTPANNFVGSRTLMAIHAQLMTAPVLWNGVWDGFPEARAFCRQLMERQVALRPTAEEALRHDWIRAVASKKSPIRRNTIA